MDRGHCLCGNVRWETDGARLWSGYCHCESCRRNCAAPVAAFFGVEDGHWRWVGIAPARYTSTPDVTRYFCANCGTPVAYASKRFPGETHFYAAGLDTPAAFEPEFHVHYAEHVPWMIVADDLPRYPHGGNEGEPE
ncbi:GFA family protein [Tropicimonas marinistellae]|uniref:GFA family protein n=1 Tax=Tropicimonas marinistellae TaxID=1739787 RepID=UPI00083706DC|nr:GFA family protein [Tropicimonas marinistellae]